MLVQFGQNGVSTVLALEHVVSARKIVNELVKMVSLVKKDAMSGRQLTRQHATQKLAHYGLIGPSGPSVLLHALPSKASNYHSNVENEDAFLVKLVKLAVRANHKRSVSVIPISARTGRTGKLLWSARQPVAVELS